MQSLVVAFVEGKRGAIVMKYDSKSFLKREIFLGRVEELSNVLLDD